MMDLWFNVDWGQMWRPDVSVLETFLRTSFIFILLFASA